jgi:2-iminobutanoate/2-iminopropanoate deaminase
MERAMDRIFVSDGDQLPKLASPISHAVAVGNICYISGQLSVDVAGNYVPDSPREEAARAFRNLFSAAKAAGFSEGDIVYIDIAFTDLSDLAEVNALYAELFRDGKRPARTVYQAAALPYGGRVKVMGVAIKDGDS